MKLKTINTREDLRRAATGMLLLLTHKLGDKKVSNYFFDLGLSAFIQGDCEALLDCGELPPEVLRVVRRIRGVASRRALFCLDKVSDAMELSVAEFTAPVEVN